MGTLKKIWRGNVEMILRGCVLTSELAHKAGFVHPDRYRKIYQDQYFVFDNRGYIPVNILKSQRDKDAAKRCTQLDDYLPLAYFARYLLNINPDLVRKRIRFVNETGCELLKIKKIRGVNFIYISKEIQKKLASGYAMHIINWKEFDEYENVIDHFVIGDWCVAILK
jgi:hypothetical protein